MFTRPEPLDKSKHQDLRLSKVNNFNFAKQISSVHLSFSEMQQAAQYYPIIFASDGTCIPTALLSLEKGKNNYIDDQGIWKVPYLPFYFRMYPFALVKIDNKEEIEKDTKEETKEDKFVLCLDPDAEHFATGQGEPLFTADGEPNEFIQGILKALKVYQEELAKTKILFTLLAGDNLIVDRKIEFQVNGQPKSIDGFKGVDMEKLLAMDDKIIAALVKNGTMPLIYSHLQSLSKIGALASGSLG